MAWKRPRQLSPDVCGILDDLYRISATKLQELLASRFKVHIVAAKHEFTDSREELGTDRPVLIISDPVSHPIPANVLFTAPPVTVRLQDTSCAFRYETVRQRFLVLFTGTVESSKSWASALANDPLIYATTFLYVFNRLRASTAIEDRNSLVTSLSRDLRAQSSSTATFQRIASALGFETGICFVHSSYAEILTPIAFTESHDYFGTLKVKHLCYWPELLNQQNGTLLVDLSAPRSGCDTCTCAKRFAEGQRQAVFVTIGYESGLTPNTPRGVFALYRKRDRPLPSQDYDLLNRVARELAAWIDELDEQLEQRLVKFTIATAEKLCEYGMTQQLDKRVLGHILQNVGNVIAQAIKDTFPFLADPSFPPSVSTAVRCGLVADSQVFGDVPQSASEFILRQGGLSSGMYFVPISPDDGGILCVRQGDSPISFVVSAALTVFAFVRPRVFDWIFDLMRLVYHLFQLEQRRLTWIHRTIHELRHPMLGLIYLGSEIQRLIEMPTTPRRDIAHYSEDMNTSILRLKVMLAIFENLAGLDRIAPQPRRMLLEGDVLRPMRRLLLGHAQNRDVNISDTIAYERVAPLESDPDLLSLVFFNVLDNAIKYADANTTVKIACSEDNGYYVDVTNRGPAISKADEARIFELGFRGRNVQTKQAGLGMGLHLAKVIAERLKCSLVLIDAGRESGEISFRLSIPKSLVCARS